MILRRFPSRLLKCSFNLWHIFLDWQLSQLLSRCFPFRLFILSHANHDCLSSSEIRILLIWMYSSCSFWYVSFFFSLTGFLKFLCIEICWVAFIKQGCFFHISFFLNCYWLLENSRFGSWFSWYAIGWIFIFINRTTSFRHFLKITWFVSDS